MAFIRVAAVVLLSAAMLACTLPDLLRVFGLPDGGLAFDVDPQGVVTRVDPSGPAAKAGIRVGDRLDVAASPPQHRLGIMLGQGTWPAPLAVNFAVDRGEQLRMVTATSQPVLSTSEWKFSVALRELLGLVFIAIGSFVVLRRPSPTSWSFFLVCLGLDPAPLSVGYWGGPFPWDVAAFTFSSAFQQNYSTVWVSLFALNFMSQPRWRAWASPIVITIGAVFIAASCFGGLYLGLAGFPPAWINKLQTVLMYALWAFALLAFIDTFVRSSGVDRQRVRWVALGFFVSLLGVLGQSLVPAFSGFGAANHSALGYTICQLLMLAGPVAVAYAILRHRVIDVNFVISRGLIYAILTSIVVAAMAVTDWFVGKVLAQTRLALATEVVVAIALGFWLNALHAKIDLLVDRVIFRKRHIAEQRLARVAAGLARAPSGALIDSMLVSEPVESLELSSAALFRHQEDGSLRRVASSGWSDECLRQIEPDSGVLVHLQGERGPVHLDQTGFQDVRLPEGTAKPVLAMPIFVGHGLDAIAFYGAHETGEDIDPDELAALRGLATSAAAAYDHLEATTLRKSVQELSTQLAVMGAEVSRFRAAPIRLD